jgi:hypothetical protein
MPQPTLEDLQKLILSLTEKFVELAGQVTQTRAAVNVLKMYAAAQMSPGDLPAALTQLQLLEKTLLDADANEKSRLEVQERIQALQEWIKSGRPPSFDS